MAERTVVWSPSAQRHLTRIPESVAAAVLELVYGALSRDPFRVGKPLQGEFADLHVARRGDYRVLYRVDGDDLQIVAIAHRRDAYRPR